MSRSFLILVIISLLFLSCKTYKTSTSTKKRATLNYVTKRMAGKEFESEWFSSKVKFNINGLKPFNSFRTSLRIRNDSIIWLSISPMLGIEAVRVLITKDTIKILDRINKKLLIKNFDYFNTIVPIKLDYNLIQRLLLGNKIYFSNEQTELEVTDRFYVLTNNSELTKSKFWIMPDHFTTQKMCVEQQSDSVKLTLVYDKYEEIGQNFFALDREINIKSKSNLAVSMKFEHPVVDKRLEFPFKIPDSYEIVR